MNRRAFTLIELLTVIAIIGVLAAILIATIGSARSNARSAQCISNLRQLGQAGQLWMADNRGHMPDAHGWRDNVNHPYSIRPYLSIRGGTENVFTCPEAYRLHPNPEEGLSDNLRTYSINLYACRTQDGSTSHENVSSNPGVLARVVHPSKMAFFMDGNLDNAAGSARRYAHSSMTNPSNIWTPGRPQGLLAVHKGRLNVAFVDGHVEALDPATLPSNAVTGTTAAQRHPFWGRYTQ